MELPNHNKSFDPNQILPNEVLNFLSIMQKGEFLPPSNVIPKEFLSMKIELLLD
jgi:hypothetical protein